MFHVLSEHPDYSCGGGAGWGEPLKDGMIGKGTIRGRQLCSPLYRHHHRHRHRGTVKGRCKFWIEKNERRDEVTLSMSKDGTAQSCQESAEQMGPPQHARQCGRRENQGERAAPSHGTGSRAIIGAPPDAVGRSQATRRQNSSSEKAEETEQPSPSRRRYMGSASWCYKCRCSRPLIGGNTFQDPQGVPETAGGTGPQIHHVSPINTHLRCNSIYKAQQEVSTIATEQL